MNSSIQQYYGIFTKLEDIIYEYKISPDEIADIEIIYAYYSHEDYTGSSHVIFRKGKELFEVNGSHCSCSGLEEQWKPEKTTLAALLFRPNVAKEAKENLKQIYPNLVPFI